MEYQFDNNEYNFYKAPAKSDWNFYKPGAFVANDITLAIQGMELKLLPNIIVEGSQTENSFGKTIWVKYQKVDTKSTEYFKCILSEIKGITRKSIDEMFETYKFESAQDFITHVEAGKKIKGIGPKKSELVLKKLEEAEAENITAEIACLIDNYNYAEKLSKSIRSLEQLYDKPYKYLSKLNIGFLAVDEIARTKLNISLDNKERNKYLIQHKFKQFNTQNSNYVDEGEFKEYLIEEVRHMPANTTVDDFIDKNELLETEDKCVYLKEIFEAETLSPSLLATFNHYPSIIDDEYNKEKFNQVIKDFESYNNFSLADSQRSAIETITFGKNTSILTGGAGCVDCDTEFFNGHEWKKISNYNINDRVLQYNKNGSASLIYPTKYHKRKKDFLWHFETKYGLDQCLSDDHNVYYITSKNNLYSKKMIEVKDNHEKTGFRGKFITTFNYSDNGLEYSENEIRLKIAIKADGHLVNKNTYHYRMNFKKKRKINRFRILLYLNNIKFIEKNRDDGYTEFNFYFNTSKTYGHNWYKCNIEQFRIIYDEIFHWDGCFKSKKTWFTTIKSDADFIQFVGTVCGKRSTIFKNDRAGKKYFTNGKIYIRKTAEYEVNFTDRKLISMCRDKRKDHTKTPINKYKTKDGFEYCFTVNSGMLVLRRNNKIFITGNCGKTTIIKALIDSLNIFKYEPLLLAPTGKAACRLSECANQKAFTIHSLVCYIEFMETLVSASAVLDRFGLTNSKKIIIIDESSMIDQHLFYRLLKTIDKLNAVGLKFEKILFVGDPFQLPSVGCGQVLNDLIESKCFTHIHLTETFRQAKDSLIIKNANKVRKKKDIDIVKTAEFFVGELNEDLIEKIYFKFKSKYNNILDFYKEFQIATITNKTREYMNEKFKIKDNSNPELKKCKFRVDDKVINLENDRERGIHNGDMGIVEHVTKKETTIYFYSVNTRIVFKNNKLKEIIHAYACTIHKLQGSESKSVLILLQNNCISDHRLLYTAITRAKQNCIILCKSQSEIFEICRKSLDWTRKTNFTKKLRKILK